jgi:hypothetical protein
VVSEKMMPGVQFPIASEKPYEFYALLETQGSRREHDEAVSVKDIEWGSSMTMKTYAYHCLETGKLSDQAIGESCSSGWCRVTRY